MKKPVTLVILAGLIALTAILLTRRDPATTTPAPAANAPPPAVPVKTVTLPPATLRPAAAVLRPVGLGAAELPVAT